MIYLISPLFVQIQKEGVRDGKEKSQKEDG